MLGFDWLEQIENPVMIYGGTFMDALFLMATGSSLNETSRLQAI